ncbi:MAG TPA: hypothetical protein VD793_02125 [Gemmatimonadales bacterium]|nr:hypothetical protein [Gemmatimonadales bacterium]
MSGQLESVEARLLAQLEVTARGPRQNGTFAVWLVVRLCDGALPPRPLGVRGGRRRLASAERRLASLPLPAPIRRGIAAAFRELGAATPGGTALALHQLVAPAREALGDDVADALVDAAQTARDALVHTPEGGTT